MVASEDFINTFFLSIRDLHSVRNSLNKEYAEELVEILQRAAKKISKHTGAFLHDLDEEKPDQDTLKKMISASPSSLCYKDFVGDLPIHTASYNTESLPYVPLLAMEGMKHNVGGEVGRGGLLVPNEDGDSPLKIFMTFNSDKKTFVDVMKELKEANLFRREDIKNHDLLYWSAYESYKQQFKLKFLCDWCPEGLKDHRYNSLPIIHAVIKNMSIKSFVKFLKVSFKHHEKEAGLLFQTVNDRRSHINDRSTITACRRAFNEYGKEKTMKVISKYIPLDNPQLPILHYVAKHAPKYMNDFSKRYTSAAYMKDSDGRNLDQAMLASGKTTFESNAMYSMRMLSDDQVREIDPLTDLYPFMVAASEQASDLSAVFVLLRRNPSLVGGGNLHDGNDRLKRKRTVDCNRIKRSKNH